jgi:cellulose biosynthesis protein BcsQ
VLSLKGGVGKTTVVLGLASAAVRRGVRTLVVDLDPQCNATAALDPPETESTLAEVLANPTKTALRSAIVPSSWGSDLDVLVGSEDIEVHNLPNPNQKALGKLTRALDKLSDLISENELDYQLVLVDCPPSLAGLTRCALVASSRALLVAEPNMFAVSGVQRAFEAVQKEREANNPDLQPLGVLVNRMRPRSYEHQFRIAELREVFGPLVLPAALPDRLALQQAQGACCPIHRWSTPGAREASLVFEGLLGRVLRSARPSDRNKEQQAEAESSANAGG